MQALISGVVELVLDHLELLSVGWVLSEQMEELLGLSEKECSSDEASEEHWSTQHVLVKWSVGTQLQHVGVGHHRAEIDGAVSSSGVEHSVEEDAESASSVVVNSFRWDQLVVLINHFVFILIII